MMARTYINAAQQRVLRMLPLLAGHAVFGLAPGEIAAALRTSPSNVTRDLANLREAGLAEPLETGRWCLTPRMGQIALRVLKSLDDAKSRVAEMEQRYTRDR